MRLPSSFSLGHAIVPPMGGWFSDSSDFFSASIKSTTLGGSGRGAGGGAAFSPVGGVVRTAILGWMRPIQPLNQRPCVGRLTHDCFSAAPQSHWPNGPLNSSALQFGACLMSSVAPERARSSSSSKTLSPSRQR